MTKSSPIRIEIVDNRCRNHWSRFVHARNDSDSVRLLLNSEEVVSMPSRHAGRRELFKVEGDVSTDSLNNIL
jgi:hypothetical protein